MTAGIYRQLGKTDLITNTPEAFVQKALDVASSSEVQQTHRAEIMALQSNLFGEDACKKARLEFESILSHLAQTHQA